MRFMLPVNNNKIVLKKKCVQTYKSHFSKSIRKFILKLFKFNE